MILLRGGAERLEVLLVKRTPKARFMGGVWVFPGGAVDARRGRRRRRPPRGRPCASCARRPRSSSRTPTALVKFSRWITPAEVQIRFDTHFFLAALPAGQEPRIDGEECVDLGWFTPPAALDAHRDGEIMLVFPTIKHLEQLATSPRSTTLLAHARGRDVQPVEPKVVLEGEVARVLLPGDPGY